MTPAHVLRLVGFLAALGSALIHLWIAPEHLDEVPYVGLLFLVGFVLLGTAIAGMAFFDDPDWAWYLGALVCTGMIIGLLLSRTIGLPGGYREGWESEAWASLVLEVVFLGCWAVRLRVPAKSGSEQEVIAGDR